MEKYLKDSERTEKKFEDGLKLTRLQAEILHASMGVSTEAGEITDQVKRHLIYGTELDTVNLVEEVGDLLWYCAIILRWSGSSFEDAMQLNTEKLKVRYPEKFTEEGAVNRDILSEREALEADTDIDIDADADTATDKEDTSKEPQAYTEDTSTDTHSSSTDTYSSSTGSQGD